MWRCCVKGSSKRLSASTDCNGRLCYLDPYRGGIWSIVEAARNHACVGAEILGISDCLNFGNPEKPEIFWQFVRCIDGMVAAMDGLGIPVVSGNVSLYNETAETAVYPTPVIAAVGLLPPEMPKISMALCDEATNSIGYKALKCLLMKEA